MKERYLHELKCHHETLYLVQSIHVDENRAQEGASDSQACGLPGGT